METPLEHALMHLYKADMVVYMESHPEDFDEAVQMAISDKPGYAWRAAWLLWSCMEVNDTRIQKYLQQIINVLPAKNDDHQRELFKILLQMELNEAHESLLFDMCTRVWEKVNKKPSVRFTAFKIIVKLAKKYPDIANEIEYFTQEQYLDSLSDAARKSIHRMVGELKPF